MRTMGDEVGVRLTDVIGSTATTAVWAMMSLAKT